MREAPVSFVIAGVQKGGTTSLSAYLRQHPQIIMPCVLESHFFDSDEYFRMPSISYDKYHALYRPPIPRCAILGDVTPIYIYWQPVMRRIYEYNDSMKFIVLLRNPIDRAYSGWQMEFRRHAESLTFADAIRSEGDRLGASPVQNRVFSYVSRGMYSEQLRRLLALFPRHQLFVTKSEQFFRRPTEVLHEVQQFLEIKYLPLNTSLIYRKAQYDSPLAASDREYLKRLFAPDIAITERLLGLDCSEWLA